MSLAPARVCGSCDLFPCRCLRVPLVSNGFPRFERCLCGGTIHADDQESVFTAVRAHNASIGHNVWRARQR